jgi:hypothetical protein
MEQPFSSSPNSSCSLFTCRGGQPEWGGGENRGWGQEGEGVTGCCCWPHVSFYFIAMRGLLCSVDGVGRLDTAVSVADGLSFLGGNASAAPVRRAGGTAAPIPPRHALQHPVGLSITAEILPMRISPSLMYQNLSVRPHTPHVMRSLPAPCLAASDLPHRLVRMGLPLPPPRLPTSAATPSHPFFSLGSFDRAPAAPSPLLPAGQTS